MTASPPPVRLATATTGLVQTLLGIGGLTVIAGALLAPDRMWPNLLLVSYYLLGLGLDEAEPVSAGGSLAAQVEGFEKTAIAAALLANGGSLKATYEALGLSRKTLYEKMHKHGLRREDFTDGEGGKETEA